MMAAAEGLWPFGAEMDGASWPARRPAHGPTAHLVQRATAVRRERWASHFNVGAPSTEFAVLARSAPPRPLTALSLPHGVAGRARFCSWPSAWPYHLRCEAHGSLYASPAPKLLSNKHPPVGCAQKRLNVDPSSSTLLPRQIFTFSPLSSLLRPPSLLPRRLRSRNPQTRPVPIVKLSPLPFPPHVLLFATCIDFFFATSFLPVRSRLDSFLLLPVDFS
jgi:hypothetical protein